jgi:hypothetical protein
MSSRSSRLHIADIPWVRVLEPTLAIRGFGVVTSAGADTENSARAWRTGEHRG